MLDWVPIRVWILIVILLIAARFAHSVYLHFHHSPHERDFTHASLEASRFSPERLTLNLIALAVLAGLAVYILTPAAEEFARSPRFWPLVMIGIGGFALYTVVAGLIRGEIEPFLKRRSTSYSRDGHPIRYWLSVAWNSATGGLLIWLALTQQF